MGYFGGSSRFAGDPGLFDTFKRIGRGALGFATGGFGGAIAGLSRRPPTPRQAATFFQAPRSGPPLPGVIAAGQRLFPGGATGFAPRRRRMNVGNAKALRRAIRRTDGFVKLARSALKNTGFKIVSKSSGKLTQAAWEKKAHHAK